jgi:cytochrome c oxidase subunit 3
MAVVLVAVVIVFVALTSAYLVRQRLDPPGVVFVVPPDPPLRLPVAILWLNTAVLLLSSVTLELARRQAAERALLAPLRSIPGITVDAAWRRPWLAFSVLLGSTFLAGQAWAWHLLMRGGQDIYAGMCSTFFYILTGMHAIHLAGGLIALLYAGATSMLLRKPLEVRRIVVDVVSWYWHVMAGLWLYIFALLTFVR